MNFGVLFFDSGKINGNNYPELVQEVKALENDPKFCNKKMILPQDDASVHHSQIVRSFFKLEVSRLDRTSW